MNNSECCNGFMHDYEIKEYYPIGLLEVCSKCKDKQFFKNNIPNHIYLSYHLRVMLNKTNPRFYKEYERK